MEFQETVNFQIARSLNGLTLQQYTYLYKKASNKRDEEGKPTEFKAEFTKLKNYCSEIISNDNKLIVSYGYTEGKDFGRLQSKSASVQRIFNGFRGLLCNGLTYDLDMENAHPNILKELCDEYEIECGYLKDYINHRGEWIEEMMITYKIDRFSTKAVFLTMINKDELTTEINGKKIKSNPQKFIEFDKQMKSILSSLFSIFKKDYYKYVKNESYNQKGKLVNLLLCKRENELLDKAKKYIKSKKINIHSLFYDGCQVYKVDNSNKEYDIEELLKGLNKLFKEDNIKWTVKPHNTELFEALSELIIEEKDTHIDIGIENISEHILKGLLKDKIIRTELGVVYLTPSKILTNEKEIDRDLYALITKQDYNIVEETENGIPKYTKVCQIPTKIKELVYSIKARAPKDDKFINNIWNETRYKLFFKNGYYDFKQSKFIEGEFNRTPIKIDSKYNSKVALKSYSDLNEKILYPIFSIEDVNKDVIRVKLMNYFLYRIARAMAGHIEDKKWLLLEGLRNSGKGVLTLLLENAFQRYVKVTNSGNFIFKESSQDEAKKQSWMIDYQFLRLAFTQEITINKNKKNCDKVDGNMIKKFCSGGDSIEARKNHCDEMQFKIQTTLMICCNDMPEITPADTKEFCEEFQMKTKFLTEEQEKLEQKIPTFLYKRANDDVKDLVKDSSIIDAFIQLLIDAYGKDYKYPEELKKQEEEIKEDDDYTKLFNIFEFTNSDKDYLSNDLITEIILDNKLPFSIIKCNKLLKAKGAEPHRKNNTRGMCRIKVKEFELDEDELEEIEKEKEQNNKNRNEVSFKKRVI
jgi:hypothetical protein